MIPIKTSPGERPPNALLGNEISQSINHEKATYIMPIKTSPERRPKKIYKKYSIRQ